MGGAALHVDIRLDREIPIPLYYQLAQRLTDIIKNGDWQPGDFFTTEEELQQSLGVSRATVRKALQYLMDEGLLERITGKGTFIARPPLKITLPHLISFSEEILQRGMTPGTKVLRLERCAPPAEVARALDIPVAEVLCVTRLRYADGEPLVYMKDYFHPRLGFVETDDFDGSLYELLESRSGMRVDAAVHQITAVLVADPVATYLEVPPGSAGLRFVRMSFDASDAPLVYEEAICRGDRYTYSIRLTRKGGLL